MITDIQSIAVTRRDIHDIFKKEKGTAKDLGNITRKKLDRQTPCKRALFRFSHNKGVDF
jgi:ABC-type bacteriocin/lantibiotic exporter with double-glycine peptidase domain